MKLKGLQWNTTMKFQKAVQTILIRFHSLFIEMEETWIAYSSARAGRPTNHGWIPCSNKRFSFLQSLQTGAGAHPASYQIYRGSSPPSSVRVKNGRSYISTPPISSLVIQGHLSWEDEYKKYKFVPIHDPKQHKGCTGISLFIPNLGSLG